MSPDRRSGRVPKQPFNLDALDDVINVDPPPRKTRWWKPAPNAPAQPVPEIPPRRSTRALLAIVPEVDQSEAILDAVRRTGGNADIAPRIVLRSELETRDDDVWQPAVSDVTRSWTPFAVRLSGPEMIGDRMLCLTVAGRGVVDLQRALSDALAKVGFPDRNLDPFSPVVLLASTFTGYTVRNLHTLAAAVRKELTLPIDFAVRSVFAYGESADDHDLPISAFPLGG